MDTKCYRKIHHRTWYIACVCRSRFSLSSLFLNFVEAFFFQLRACLAAVCFLMAFLLGFGCFGFAIQREQPLEDKIWYISGILLTYATVKKVPNFTRPTSLLLADIFHSLSSDYGRCTYSECYSPWCWARSGTLMLCIAIQGKDHCLRCRGSSCIYRNGFTSFHRWTGLEYRWCHSHHTVSWCHTQLDIFLNLLSIVFIWTTLLLWLILQKKYVSIYWTMLLSSDITWIDEF